VILAGGHINLADVAPTVAAWLGLAMPSATGRVLDLAAPR